MEALAKSLTETINPFAGVMSKVNRWFQIIGYARAAGELTRLGFHKEAQECMKQAAKL